MPACDSGRNLGPLERAGKADSAEAAVGARPSVAALRGQGVKPSLVVVPAAPLVAAGHEKVAAVAFDRGVDRSAADVGRAVEARRTAARVERIGTFACPAVAGAEHTASPAPRGLQAD